jgi:hypothetical protein
LLNIFKSGAGYFNSVKWGSYAIAISLLRQLCLVPIFIVSVGEYGYSFWIILSTIVTLLTALNLGHLHYSSNVINITYHLKGTIEKEIKRIQGANYLYVTLQLIIGVLLSFTPVLSLVTSFPANFIQQNYSGIGFLLLLTGRIFLQYSGLFLLRLLEPVGRIETTLKFQAIGEIVDFAAVASAIFFTGSILLTCIAAFVANLLFTIGMLIFVSKIVPFKIFLHKVNIPDALQFMKNSFSLNSSFLIERAYDTGLNLVIVRLFNTSVLPVFTTSRVLTNIFYRICWVIVIPLFPDIQKRFALKDSEYVIEKIKLFWSFVSVFIIFSVTVSLPFLPYIYSVWTHNKLGFNIYIVCFLFMAVSFQNFGMIINEFFKKTNFSKQILILNTIKSLVTISAIVLFGSVDYEQGLAIALIFGEFLCLVYSIHVLINIFKEQINWAIAISYFIPVLLFCLSMVIYLWELNYWVFFTINTLIIIFYMSKIGTFKNLIKLINR